VLDRALRTLVWPRRTIAAAVGESGPAWPAPVLLGLVWPVALVVALSVIGVRLSNPLVPAMAAVVRFPPRLSLPSAFALYAALLAGWRILAALLVALAPTFEGRRDARAAMTVATAACTPLWMSGLAVLCASVRGLDFIPALAQTAGILYGAVIAVRATPPHLGTPPPKAWGHALLAAGLALLAGFVIRQVLASGVPSGFSGGPWPGVRF